MGGSYQQEVDLLTLYKDAASQYVQMVTVPEQLPNVLDRAIRVALDPCLGTWPPWDPACRTASAPNSATLPGP
jgi:hypothetical protein